MSWLRITLSVVCLAGIAFCGAMIWRTIRAPVNIQVVGEVEVTSTKTIVVVERLPWLDGYTRGCVLLDKTTGQRYLMVLNGDRGGISVTPLGKEDGK